MIASAWALRNVAVEETLPALLKKASYLTDVRLRQQNFEEIDLQAAHLFEALGRMKYQPAEPLMRRYIRKDYVMGEYSRSAAIWGLGLLHVSKPDEALAGEIAGRVTEPGVANPPEFPRVRLAGAIALARMKASSQSRALRDFLPNTGDSRVYMAIRWALKEITGEEVPLLPPVTISRGGWFLEPLDAVAP